MGTDDREQPRGQSLQDEAAALRQRLAEVERTLDVAQTPQGGSHDTPVALESIVDSLHEGLQIIDPDFRYLYLNEAAASHGRRHKEELIGRTMIEAYPGIEGTDVFRHIERCMRERCSHRMDNLFEFPDGSHEWFELRMFPVPQGLLVLSIDIGARRSLEQQLANAQKMEAVGRLAGGVAHDFNNLLTIIGSYSCFVAAALAENHPARADVDQIQSAAARATQITQQLLALTSGRVSQAELVSVNDALGQLEPMLKRLAGEDVTVTLTLPAESPVIRIQPGNLDQILMNLTTNARDAMPNGGTLSIRVALAVLDHAYTETHHDVAPGDYVLIDVTDTGEGIDDEILARIFDPFFTTKAPGKGTGLGLATSHGLVRQAAGHIWAYSERGSGTTFKIYLPLVTQPARSPVRPAQPMPVELRGTETVMVVDDEASLRALCVRALKDYGYTVFEAENAADARRLCERYSGPIHLVITDVVMPGDNGPELIEHINASRPKTRSLFTSGYADHQLIESIEPHRYLEKPFTPEALVRKVRALLSRSDSGQL